MSVNEENMGHWKDAKVLTLARILGDTSIQNDYQAHHLSGYRYYSVKKKISLYHSTFIPV